MHTLRIALAGFLSARLKSRMYKVMAMLYFLEVASIRYHNWKDLRFLSSTTAGTQNRMDISPVYNITQSNH